MSVRHFSNPPPNITTRSEILVLYAPSVPCVRESDLRQVLTTPILFFFKKHFSLTSKCFCKHIYLFNAVCSHWTLQRSLIKLLTTFLFSRTLSTSGMHVFLHLHNFCWKYVLSLTASNRNDFFFEDWEFIILGLTLAPLPDVLSPSFISKIYYQALHNRCTEFQGSSLAYNLNFQCVSVNPSLTFFVVVIVFRISSGFHCRAELLGRLLILWGNRRSYNHLPVKCRSQWEKLLEAIKFFQPNYSSTHFPVIYWTDRRRSSFVTALVFNLLWICVLSHLPATIQSNRSWFCYLRDFICWWEVERYIFTYILKQNSALASYFH